MNDGEFEVGDYLGEITRDGYMDGFCGGCFGRDGYELKRVTSVKDDLLVVEYTDGKKATVEVGPSWKYPIFPSWETALKYRVPKEEAEEYGY